MGDSFVVIASTLKRKMLWSPQKSISGTRHTEFVVVCTTQRLQLCSPPKTNVEQRSFHVNLEASTFFFQIDLKQICCKRVSCNSFLDTARVHQGNTSIDDNIQKSQVSFRAKGLFPWKCELSKATQLGKTLRRERGWGMSLLETFFRNIYSAAQNCKSLVHNLRIVRAEE